MRSARSGSLGSLVTRKKAIAHLFIGEVLQAEAILEIDEPIANVVRSLH